MLHPICVIASRKHLGGPRDLLLWWKQHKHRICLTSLTSKQILLDWIICGGVNLPGFSVSSYTPLYFRMFMLWTYPSWTLSLLTTRRDYPRSSSTRPAPGAAPLRARAPAGGPPALSRHPLSLGRETKCQKTRMKTQYEWLTKNDCEADCESL